MSKKRRDNPVDPPRSEVILYQTEDGQTRIECRFQNESIWLTQALMAELFQTTPQNVTLHIKAIYEDGELSEEATCKDYLQVRREGNREVSRNLRYYGLPVILSVGYRVRSQRGASFVSGLPGAQGIPAVQGLTCGLTCPNNGKTNGVRCMSGQHGQSGLGGNSGPGGPGGEELIPTHGGYRKLKSFQVAQLAYDVTVRFCDRYIDRRSRTHDQMVQVARSGVQNIAEGSQASGTSKKFELKLTSVARASLEELRLDYEDFLRQRGLALWERNDRRRAELIHRRCSTADEVARWARDVHQESECCGPHGQSGPSISSTQSTYAEIAANGALLLIAVACSLLDRQLAAQSKAFEQEGGFTERLYRRRQQARRQQ